MLTFSSNNNAIFEIINCLHYCQKEMQRHVKNAEIAKKFQAIESMLLEQAHSVFQTTKKFESKNVYNLLYKDELTKMNHQIEYLEKEKARLQHEAEQHTATIKQLREQSSLKTVSNA